MFKKIQLLYLWEFQFFDIISISNIKWQQQIDIAAIILTRENITATIIERDDIVWERNGNHNGGRNFQGHHNLNKLLKN